MSDTIGDALFRVDPQSERKYPACPAFGANVFLLIRSGSSQDQLIQTKNAAMLMHRGVSEQANDWLRA